MTQLDWTHAVRDVPADGLAVSREASESERLGLAKVLEIPAVETLVVAYRLVPKSGGRLALTGSIKARLTQECVVTLEPVATSVEADLDVEFTPDAAASDGDIESSHEDLGAPDEEPIENGVVDIGRIVTEELISGLDPYPRREGVSFDWTDEKGEAAGEHPFAALAKLKAPKPT